MNTSIVSSADKEPNLQSRYSVTEISGFDKDYVPVPWKAVPQVLRHIAKEVKTIEATGGKFSVGFEQLKKYGGAKGRIDRFPITSEDIELAADCFKYIQGELDKGIDRRDKGQAVRIFGGDNTPIFLQEASSVRGSIYVCYMEGIAYTPPVFMERRITAEGEEFIIDSELLQKETTRWMMAYHYANGKSFRGRHISNFRKPFCDSPGQALMYIGTLAKEVNIGGEIELIPLEIPSVLINRGYGESKLYRYYKVPESR